MILFLGLYSVVCITYSADKQTAVVLLPEEIDWLTQHKISIAVVDSWFPYSFKSPTDESIGYHLDLLDDIELNTKISFEIKRFSNWNSAIAAVESGIVHAIIGASPSKKRSEKLFFSSAYLFSQTEIFSQATNLSIDDLIESRFAVIEGDILNDYVKHRFPKATIVKAEHDLALFKLVKDKKADVGIVVNAGIANHHFSQFNTIERLATQGGEFTIATSRQFEMIASIIRKGVRSLSIPQKQQLFEKWLATSSKHSIFNDSELYFLRKHPILTVGSEVWPQLMGHNQDHFNGITGFVFNELETLMGVELVPIYDEKPLLLNALQKKNIDIVAEVTNDESYHEKGLFSQNYFSLPISLLSNRHNDMSQLSDLVHYKIAIERPLYNNLPAVLLNQSIVFEVVESNQQAFDLMKSNKVKFILTSMALLDESLKHAALDYHQQYITDIEPIDFRFMTNKQVPVLQSILQKSLSHIQRSAALMNEEGLKTRTVEVITQRAKLPYFTENDIIKGIGHDIVQAVLALANITVNQYSQSEVDTINQTFSTTDSLEIMSMVKKGINNHFYSDELISYTDVVVSRLDRNFHFKEMSDLKDKSIIAWVGASEELGEEYARLFNIKNRPDNYQEVENQQSQIELLIANKVDVIVIDRTMLDWHINQINPSIVTELKVDYIFPNTLPRYAAFKDKKLRDLFNHHLRALKKSGKYQTIVSRYTHGAIRAGLYVRKWS